MLYPIVLHNQIRGRLHMGWYRCATCHHTRYSSERSRAHRQNHLIPRLLALGTIWTELPSLPCSRPTGRSQDAVAWLQGWTARRVWFVGCLNRDLLRSVSVHFWAL